MADLLARPLAALLASCAVTVMLAGVTGCATAGAGAKSASDANRDIARTAYESVLGQGRFELAEQYFEADYIQHNARIPTGRAGLVGYLKAFRAQYPEQEVRVLRVVAEGDIVVIHSLWDVSNPQKDTRLRMAIADIFRVKAGKMAEHWDVIQVIPER